MNDDREDVKNLLLSLFTDQLISLMNSYEFEYKEEYSKEQNIEDFLDFYFDDDLMVF